MTGGCGANTVLCADFEGLSGTDLPQGLSYTGCEWGNASLTLGNGVATLSSPGNYCEAWLNIDALNDMTSAYLRFEVTTNGAPTGGNRWFMLLESGAGANMNGESTRIRLFDNNAMAWNVEGKGDTVSPDVFSPGQAAFTKTLPVTGTMCMEVFFDETNDLVQIWVNDEEVVGLEIDNDPNSGHDSRLLGSYGGFYDVDVQTIRLGWGGGPAATLDYDNIVVSTSPIGCP